VLLTEDEVKVMKEQRLAGGAQKEYRDGYCYVQKGVTYCKMKEKKLGQALEGFVSCPVE
jgi:hypothetical protein